MNNFKEINKNEIPFSIRKLFMETRNLEDIILPNNSENIGKESFIPRERPTLNFNCPFLEGHFFLILKNGQTFIMNVLVLIGFLILL